MNAKELLLGDSALAFGALDAGLAAAYGYPGTPSTEIMETILELVADGKLDSPPVARWCANEKTALEQGLGAAMAGARVLVTMKHVGLNVAADPFVNAALLDLPAGLVVAVADDPGMASSQNEQDSRYYADLAGVPCLEPATQQEAYDMARLAFDLSEELSLPVLLRMVTRVAHARAPVERVASEGRLAPRVTRRGASGDRRGGGPDWTLVPSNARRRRRAQLDRAHLMVEHGLASRFNRFYPSRAGGAGPGAVTPASAPAALAGDDAGAAAGRAGTTLVVTAGLAAGYYQDIVGELPGKDRPAHLHVGYHPLDPGVVSRALDGITRVLVLEDGYPFVERLLRREAAPGVVVDGRENEAVPADGEITAERIRRAMGLPESASTAPGISLPPRPPRFCAGCPHADSFSMLETAVAAGERTIVTSDIGCYALAAMPPYHIIDSVVCMGASIGMAAGAADAGVPGVVATIGDSTFLHSGIPALIDAVESGSTITVLILDNETVGMTGGQTTVAPTERIEAIARAVGVAEDHVVVLRPGKRAAGENSEILRREIEYPGVSVVIARRACVQVGPSRRKQSAPEEAS